MNTVAKLSTEAVPASSNNLVISAIAVFCGLGMVALFCMAPSGLDMSIGFF
jgi:hypothetical protein